MQPFSMRAGYRFAQRLGKFVSTARSTTPGRRPALDQRARRLAGYDGLERLLARS